MFRLDRSAFKIQTHEQASKTSEYWLSKSPQERFDAAWFLICAAYDIDVKNPPRLDRSAFSMRKNG